MANEQLERALYNLIQAGVYINSGKKNIVIRIVKVNGDWPVIHPAFDGILDDIVQKNQIEKGSEREHELFRELKGSPQYLVGPVDDSVLHYVVHKEIVTRPRIVIHGVKEHKRTRHEYLRLSNRSMYSIHSNRRMGYYESDLPFLDIPIRVPLMRHKQPVII